VVVAVPDNTNVWPTYYQDEALALAKKSISNPMLDTTLRVKIGEQTVNTQDVTRRDIGGQNQNKPKSGEIVTATNTTSTSDSYEYHLQFRSVVPMTTPNTLRQGDALSRPIGMPGNAPTPGNSPPNPSGPAIREAGGLMAPQNSDLRLSRPDLQPPSGSIGGMPATGIGMPGRP
jgi:hypothetical protein